MLLESILDYSFHFVVVSGLCACLYYWIFSSKYSGLRLPPGPRGVPILGYLPFLGKDVHVSFKEVARKYGSVFGLHIGTQYVIVVEDFKALKEICTKNEFMDRPPGYFRITEEHRNLIETTGAEWKDHHTFQVSTLKHLGMTTKTTHFYTLMELKKAISTLTEKAKEPRVNLETVLGEVFDNIIYFILYGKPFAEDHPYTLNMAAFTEAISMKYRWEEDSVFKPWLMPLLPILYPRKKKRYEKNILSMTVIIRNEIEERGLQLDPENLRTFIDYFLLEMKKRENPVKDGYTENNLVGNVVMLLAAGSVTTRVTLTWYLMALAMYPEIQERCYSEIMDFLGSDRDPEEGDQQYLPYLCATIAESQRMYPITHLNLLRQCNIDGAKLAGFDVPKGTILLQNLWAINYNEELWADPHTFKPERFLQDNGQRYQAPEHHTPFSYGKRQCLGMKLASTALFLSAVCLIRHFRFIPPEGGVDMEEVMFFNATPGKPFVALEVRKPRA